MSGASDARLKGGQVRSFPLRSSHVDAPGGMYMRVPVKFSKCERNFGYRYKEESGS